MTTLKFNRDKARTIYLRDYAVLRHSPRKLELLLLCGELLARNPALVKEWKELKRLEEGGKETYQDFRAAATSFFKKWRAHYPSLLLHPEFPAKDVPVVVTGASREDATISITVDLRFSKARIMEEVETYVDKWMEWRREEIEDPPPWLNWDKKHKTDPPNLVEGRITDLDTIQRQLNVWDAKTRDKNLTWAEIAKQCKLESAAFDHDVKHRNVFDKARNDYRAAQKLIENGLPGFFPFPK